MKDLEKELKEQYRQLGDVLNQQEIVNNQIAKRYMNSRITMFWFDWVLYALVGCYRSSDHRSIRSA